MEEILNCINYKKKPTTTKNQTCVEDRLENE